MISLEKKQFLVTNRGKSQNFWAGRRKQSTEPKLKNMIF